MKQLLLFSDPRPLVERLGAAFFRTVPGTPGVYLMRDDSGNALYVGKARNLRKRLQSYRVANPDKMRRRHLRLLRRVTRIDLEEWPDEASALAREGELLRRLQPRFNRAGVWPGNPHFIQWRLEETRLVLGVSPEAQPGWQARGPFGAGARYLQAALARLLWCVVHPELRPHELPGGWIRGRAGKILEISGKEAKSSVLGQIEARLASFFEGDQEGFAAWIRETTHHYGHTVDVQLRDADLELIGQFGAKTRQPAVPGVADTRVGNPA